MAAPPDAVLPGSRGSARPCGIGCPRRPRRRARDAAALRARAPRRPQRPGRGGPAGPAPRPGLACCRSEQPTPGAHAPELAAPRWKPGGARRPGRSVPPPPGPARRRTGGGHRRAAVGRAHRGAPGLARPARPASEWPCPAPSSGPRPRAAAPNQLRGTWRAPAYPAAPPPPARVPPPAGRAPAPAPLQPPSTGRTTAPRQQRRQRARRRDPRAAQPGSAARRRAISSPPPGGGRPRLARSPPGRTRPARARRARAAPPTGPRVRPSRAVRWRGRMRRSWRAPPPAAPAPARPSGCAGVAPRRIRPSALPLPNRSARRASYPAPPPGARASRAVPRSTSRCNRRIPRQGSAPGAGSARGSRPACRCRDEFALELEQIRDDTVGDRGGDLVLSETGCEKRAIDAVGREPGLDEDSRAPRRGQHHEARLLHPAASARMYGDDLVLHQLRPPRGLAAVLVELEVFQDEVHRAARATRGSRLEPECVVLHFGDALLVLGLRIGQEVGLHAAGPLDVSP